MSLARALLILVMSICGPVFAAAPTPPATTTVTTTMTTAPLLNINTATAKDFMKVKGLNAPKARAIVAYRTKHGSFKSLNDLAKVKGFNKLKADQLQEIQRQLSTE